MNIETILTIILTIKKDVHCPHLKDVMVSSDAGVVGTGDSVGGDDDDRSGISVTTS